MGTNGACGAIFVQTYLYLLDGRHEKWFDLALTRSTDTFEVLVERFLNLANRQLKLTRVGY